MPDHAVIGGSSACSVCRRIYEAAALQSLVGEIERSLDPEGPRCLVHRGLSVSGQPYETTSASHRDDPRLTQHGTYQIARPSHLVRVRTNSGLISGDGFRLKLRALNPIVMRK